MTFPTSTKWGGRADLSAGEFDDLILQRGYKVIWEQSIFCSCLDDSGSPDYMCPVCKNQGYIYFSPTEIRALITSISGNKEQDRIGLNEKGTAYMTCRAGDNVGFRDKFTFTDFTMKYSELIKRTGEPNDLMRFECKSMVAIMQLDTTYIPDVDYTISSDGRYINWIGSAPAIGDKYSVLYNTCPVYIAQGPIHELRGTYTMKNGLGEELFVLLPKQFQIKRADFIDD